MCEMKQIRTLLEKHPDLTTVEDVLDKCKENGIETGLWTVYFVGIDLGRRFSRRLSAPDQGKELRELALIFVGLHKGMDNALTTLNELQKMNDDGTHVSWKNESTQTTHGWELSVAQEFVDLAGGVAMARQFLRRL